MLRIKRLLASLIARHDGQTDKLAEDAQRAAELCAAGQLTAAEYAEIKTLLPGVTIAPQGGDGTLVGESAGGGTLI